MADYKCAGRLSRKRAVQLLQAAGMSEKSFLVCLEGRQQQQATHETSSGSSQTLKFTREIDNRLVHIVNAVVQINPLAFSDLCWLQSHEQEVDNYYLLAGQKRSAAPCRYSGNIRHFLALSHSCALARRLNFFSHSVKVSLRTPVKEGNVRGTPNGKAVSPERLKMISHPLCSSFHTVGAQATYYTFLGCTVKLY